LSGLRASPWCPSQRDEWVDADAVARDCTWHVPRSGTPNAELRRALVTVDWPTEYVAWARTERLLDQRIPLLSAGRTAATAQARPITAPALDRLRIVNPPDGAVYLIDPTLRREFQTLPLRAAAGDSVAVEWRIDGRPITQGGAGAAVEWPLVPGAHTVTL